MRLTHTRTLRRLQAASLVTASAVLLAACGGSSGEVSGGESSEGKAAAECGQVPVIAPEDPDGVIETLPEELQEAYNAFGVPVLASAWADKEALGRPAKVGFSYLPPSNPFGAAMAEQIKVSFAEAKKEGLVQGNLVSRILTDPATMTPAEQIRGYNELVDSGVDIIYLTPLSDEAMVDAVEAAGKKGVVTIIMGGTMRSEYAINVIDNSYLNVAEPAAAAVDQLGGEGNVVIVRGFQGQASETIGYQAVKDVLAACPDMELIGEVTGSYTPAVAKSELLKFLASHPQDIAMVPQLGTMGSGVYAAFESAGRDMPKVVDAGASAASLAYWRDLAADGYETAATGGNGTQQMRAFFEVGMQVMQGAGVKVGTITREPSLITQDNLDEYLPEGATTSSPGEVLDGEPWMPDEYLAGFFENPQ